MTTFINTLGAQTTIEFERSFKKGYIVMKMYSDKYVKGDCWEIPEAAIDGIISNLINVKG
jgi:hypothetical protein